MRVVLNKSVVISNLPWTEFFSGINSFWKKGKEPFFPYTWALDTVTWRGSADTLFDSCQLTITWMSDTKLNTDIICLGLLASKCPISLPLTWRGGRIYERTILSEPKFLGCRDDPIFLPKVLRRARKSPTQLPQIDFSSTGIFRIFWHLIRYRLDWFGDDSHD